MELEAKIERENTENNDYNILSWSPDFSSMI